MEVSAAEIWTEATRKRMRGRFRAALAGLLELEVLRVKHKEMVESVLEKHNSPDDVDDLLTVQSGLHEYWVEESSLTLKLKRSSSHENFVDVENHRRFMDLRKTYAYPSSEPHHLHDLHSHECEDRQSRVSSGFYESLNDSMGSLSTSQASLSHQSTQSSAGYGQKLYENSTWRSHLLKNNQEHSRNSDTMTAGFSQCVVPEAGFLSVVNLYPDSHWSDISDILQPKIILESCYRSDLKSRHSSEVYCYPSPLHAVALQSPLYAPQSPEQKGKNKRSSPGTFISTTSSLPKPDFVHENRRAFGCTFSHPDSPTIMSLTLPPSWLENPWCEEIVLKRARGEMWSHRVAECSEVSWSRRSLASLHHACPTGKCGKSSSFKTMLFHNRDTRSSESESPRSSQIPSPGFRGRLGTHKNRHRRHTAALTNLKN